MEAEVINALSFVFFGKGEEPIVIVLKLQVTFRHHFSYDGWFNAPGSDPDSSEEMLPGTTSSQIWCGDVPTHINLKCHSNITGDRGLALMQMKLLTSTEIYNFFKFTANEN